jgi:hypothetical protein
MTKIIFKMDSVEFLAPAGFQERVELPVDGESIEAPVFESHKRGKNWSCYFTGKNAANADRHFLPRRGKVIDISRLSRGMPFEIAGDYTSSGGTPHPMRWIGVVVERTDDLLIVDKYASVAKAMSAANKEILSYVVPDDDEEAEAELTDPGPLAVHAEALESSVTGLKAWLTDGEGILNTVTNEVAFGESVALVLQGLARLQWEKEHGGDQNTAAA